MRKHQSRKPILLEKATKCDACAEKIGSREIRQPPIKSDPEPTPPPDPLPVLLKLSLHNVQHLP